MVAAPAYETMAVDSGGLTDVFARLYAPPRWGFLDSSFFDRRLGPTDFSPEKSNELVQGIYDHLNWLNGSGLRLRTLSPWPAEDGDRIDTIVFEGQGIQGGVHYMAPSGAYYLHNGVARWENWRPSNVCARLLVDAADARQAALLPQYGVFLEQRLGNVVSRPYDPNETGPTENNHTILSSASRRALKRLGVSLS